MNKSLIELRPDRDLLDPSFDGYKLYLDPIPILSKNLDSGVDVLQISKNHYSFLHVKAFSLHNHLHNNPHKSEVYFIDKKLKVTKIVFFGLNRIEGVYPVCEIPSNFERKDGDYNTSMQFPNANIAVMSDGAGTLHIADTQQEPWIISFSGMVCKENIKYVIIDAEIFWKEDKIFLHVLLQHIEEKENANNLKNESLYQNILEWICFTQTKNQSWVKESERTIICDGSIDCCTFEEWATAVNIISNKLPRFTYDSANPIEMNIEETSKTAPKEYTWCQTTDNVTVTFSLPNETDSKDIKITTELQTIDVKIKEKAILSGTLNHKINKDLTTWTLQNNKLEIQITKEEGGVIWQLVVVGDDRGELVDLKQEGLGHSSDKIEDQPSFNTSQLEECDAVSSDSMMYRLDVQTHTVTHEISLSAFPWLFKLYNKPTGVCLRHDVDACVWQFKRAYDSSWPSIHIGTFHAFGYVQASKSEKKFMAAPPNCSYVVICDVMRHIYVYRQPDIPLTELRNRSTGRRVGTIAKQQLVNIETNEEILGVYATNNALFVLTENSINILVIDF